MTARTSSDPFHHLRRRTDLPGRQNGMDLALYDPVADRIHMLNPVAAAVWHQATPDRSFKQIHEMLALSFDKTSRATIKRDLNRFIQKLKRLKLLVPRSRKDKPISDVARTGVIIPGTIIDSLNKGYAAPDVTTYTFAQLDRLVRKASNLRVFCDLLMVTPAKGDM